MKCTRLVGLLFAGAICAGSAGAAELKFVTEPFPPFSYEAPGSNRGAGPMADVVMAVCERVKASCSIEVLPWRRAVSMAENGEVDGIFSLLRTPEREKVYFLTEPIVESAYSLFAQESSQFKYTQPKDMDGYVIGVYGPSGTSTVLEEVLKSGSSGRAEVDVNNVAVLKKLAAGRYGDGKGLAAINRDVGLYLMKTESISGIKPVGDLRKIGYSVGFSRKKVQEPDFKQFNDALKALTKEGKVKAILEKYSLKAAE